MSFPIVFLSMEYLVASSKALWAKPTAPAATCQYKQVNQTFACIWQSYTTTMEFVVLR